MRKLLFLFLILLIGLALIFLKSDIKITEKDNNKEVKLKVGATFTIWLAGNPTSGYQWQINNYDPKFIKQIGKEEYFSEGKRNMVGTGGHYKFTFKALAPGETRLELNYLRPWEKNILPIKTFEVLIRSQ